jgi:ribonuclease HI
VTDSEYVAKGATEYVKTWAARGWKTAKGKCVANKDMWTTLSERMGEYAQAECEVASWKVSKEWNKVAGDAAREAAGGSPVEEYCLVNQGR